MRLTPRSHPPAEMHAPRYRNVYPVVRLVASLLLMATAGSAMYAAILVLEPAAGEFGTGRGAGSMPYTLFMIGFGLGGIMMGRLSDRFGIVVPALLASLCLPAGLLLSARATELWQFSASLGLLCGLFGMAATFAPVASDISHWFTARRGLAVGIVISGTYVAGAVWPPVLQHLIDTIGWRETFRTMGLLALCTMPPLSVMLYRRAPVDHRGGHAAAGGSRRPLGFSGRSLQGLLCIAGVGCCAAMAMPQVHVVPLTIDLGFDAAHGARMLALMLGFGVVSRLVSGWLSDRIGGLKTLLLGSMLQGLVIFAYLFAGGLTTLYVLAVAFGLSQGGIVPSYTMIIRALFPAGEAGWRIGMTMLFTVCGMALGGWLAGALYDLTGDYTASILAALGFNVLNFGIAAWLLARDRRPPAGAATARVAGDGARSIGVSRRRIGTPVLEVDRMPPALPQPGVLRPT